MKSPKSIFTMAATAVILTGAFALSGCDGTLTQTPEDKREAKQEQRLESIRGQGIEINKIDLPEEFYQLSKGTYEVKIQTKDGIKDCIANVTRTTHGHTNVTLDCN
jgi:hypothetical protein